MRYIAFLRAVNLGGRTVKMDRLKASFDALDLDNVATFIASGNVIFDSRRAAAGLERAIEARLERDFGFVVTTMIRSMEQLRMVQQHVATRLQPAPGDSLYVGFLKTAPSAKAASAALALSTAVDRLGVEGRELYWLGARGLGQTTISAARLERLLATPATLRNVNTVDRIVDRFGNG
jgi:uncharacterized protein (DUF1697 family)